MALLCLYFLCFRLHNKGVYFKMGLRKMVNRRSCKDLQRSIKVEVDGKPLDLPPVEGIIITNILRYAYCFSWLMILPNYSSISVSMLVLIKAVFIVYFQLMFLTCIDLNCHL